jgi:hypothetical protein
MLSKTGEIASRDIQARHDTLTSTNALILCGGSAHSTACRLLVVYAVAYVLHALLHKGTGAHGSLLCATAHVLFTAHQILDATSELITDA